MLWLFTNTHTQNIYISLIQYITTVQCTHTSYSLSEVSLKFTDDSSLTILKKLLRIYKYKEWIIITTIKNTILKTLLKINWWKRSTTIITIFFFFGRKDLKIKFKWRFKREKMYKKNIYCMWCDVIGWFLNQSLSRSQAEEPSHLNADFTLSLLITVSFAFRGDSRNGQHRLFLFLQLINEDN